MLAIVYVELGGGKEAGDLARFLGRLAQNHYLFTYKKKLDEEVE